MARLEIRGACPRTLTIELSNEGRVTLDVLRARAASRDRTVGMLYTALIGEAERLMHDADNRRYVELDNLATSLGCIANTGRGWAPRLAVRYLTTPPVGSIEAMAAWLALEAACPDRAVAGKLLDAAWTLFADKAHALRIARQAG